MQKPFEVWEAPEVCFVDDMDESIDEVVDADRKSLVGGCSCWDGVVTVWNSLLRDEKLMLLPKAKMKL